MHFFSCTFFLPVKILHNRSVYECLNVQFNEQFYCLEKEIKFNTNQMLHHSHQSESIFFWINNKLSSHFSFDPQNNEKKKDDINIAIFICIFCVNQVGYAFYK